MNEYIEKLLQKKDELIDRLDNLEGCEDNEVYAQNIKEIRRELSEIEETLQTELF